MITRTQPPHNDCQPLSLAPGAALKLIPDGMLKIGEDRVTDKNVKSERPCEGVLGLRLSHGRLKAWGNPNFEPTSLYSNTLSLTQIERKKTEIEKVLNYQLWKTVKNLLPSWMAFPDDTDTPDQSVADQARSLWSVQYFVRL